MGLSHAFLADLLKVKRAGVLEGGKRVVEIGAQQLADDFLTAPVLDEVYQAFGRTRIDLGAPVGTARFTEAAPASRVFWQSLGFSYQAIDFNGHRDSTALDLNRERVPERLRGAFDLVVNCGTTEHVANQDNAFRVIHDLCRKGGVMMHEVPAGGYINHGMINYHPRFFSSLSAFNRYSIIFFRLNRGGPSAIPEIGDLSNQPEEDDLNLHGVFDLSINAAFVRNTNDAFVTPLDVPEEVLPLKHREPLKGLRHVIATKLGI